MTQTSTQAAPAIGSRIRAAAGAGWALPGYEFTVVGMTARGGLVVESDAGGIPAVNPLPSEVEVIEW